MRRLPRFEPVEEALEGEVPEPSLVLPGHLAAVVVASSRVDGTRFVESLRRAFASLGVEPSIEPAGAIEPAPSPESLEERLPRGGPYITVGALGVALLRPPLRLLHTGGEPAASWSSAARALRGRFNLELPEARPLLFDELARRAVANR